MTAFITYADPLLVTIGQSFATGENYIDNRSLWHGVDALALSGAWYKDAGPRGMETSLLERRAFCLNGTATINFTGRTLIARLNLAFSWFTGATVTIDGVAPSTLGALFARDVLSCDAATYSLTFDTYLDVVVADGLSDGAHTCVITIASPDTAKFFSIAGYKVGTLATQPVARRDGWLVPLATAVLGQNELEIEVRNRGAATVVNPTLTFPAGLRDDSAAPLDPLSAAFLAPGDALLVSVWPSFTGDEHSAVFPYSLTLSGEYADPDGVIVSTTTVTLLVGNEALVITGTWFTDTSTPTGQARRFTSTFGAGTALALTFNGDALTLTVQQALSWGTLGVYAADNTSLLASVSCNVDSAALGVHVLTGFGTGDHAVFLRKTVDDGAFVVFVSAAWSVTQTFTEVTETVVLNYAAQQPYAMTVVDPTLSATAMSFTAPDPAATDYTGTPVRKNTDLSYTEMLSRFPTFAVCYQSGFSDVLSQYDVLIVDPFAVHASDVAAWRAAGIVVYGYISSGEEFGFYSNRYDFASALGPNGGGGAGGFAEYYMRTRDGTNPDQDGVWAAYYTNPDPALGWPTRLAEYYAPLVLDGPLTVIDEVVTLQAATITAGAVLVFDVAHPPFDTDFTIGATTMDGGHYYAMYSDFTFDSKTGAVVMSTAVSPAVTAGQQLKVSYTRKGLQADGVFFDTVDTPDVYGSDAFGYVLVDGYAAQFAAMINNFAAAYPAAKIISNRGFTILDDIIANCDGVMFESWLTLPTDIAHLTTTDYYAISDQPTIDGNEAVNVQLRRLRADHEFDVYSLNYVLPGTAGDTLRAYCRAKDAERGYLSWQSTITLDTPQPNTIAASTPGLPETVGIASFLRVMMRSL